MRWRPWFLMMVLFVLATGAAGVWLIAQTCGVRVAVKNLGPEAISSVVVHVRGNSHPIGDLKVGESRTVRVDPHGESGVEVEFVDLAGRKSRLDAGGYFEGSHYRGLIEIDLYAGEIKRNDNHVRISLY